MRRKVVFDGSTIGTRALMALTSAPERVQRKLMVLSRKAETVIYYRTSPVQKASIIKMKDRYCLAHCSQTGRFSDRLIDQPFILFLFLHPPPPPDVEQLVKNWSIN